MLCYMFFYYSIINSLVKKKNTYIEENKNGILLMQSS